MTEQPVHIDVSQIPKVELNILCSTILESVQRFYEDPENRRRFEAWRKTYGGANEATEKADPEPEAAHDR